jgi:hypothetical protein
MEGAAVQSREIRLRLKGDAGMLFRATQHIINKRAVQIFTTRADEIKKGFMIFHIIFGIN